MRLPLLILLGVVFSTGATGQTVPDAELRLDHAGYESMLQHRRTHAESARGFVLPVLRAYNAAGHEVLDVVGFEADTFADTLGAAAAPGRASIASLTLSDELAPALDSTGAAADLTRLPTAELTIVEYWAEWCTPCHAQANAVAAFITSRPDLAVGWVKVEADLAAYHEEETGQEVHVIGSRAKREQEARGDSN